MALNIEEGTRETPGGRFWEIDMSSSDEAERQAAEERDRSRAAKTQEAIERDAEKVLAVLARFPDGATKTTIRDRGGLNGARTGAAIAWLLGDGQIVETTIMVSNHRTPQLAYKLAETEGEI